MRRRSNAARAFLFLSRSLARSVSPDGACMLHWNPVAKRKRVKEIFRRKRFCCCSFVRLLLQSLVTECASTSHGHTMATTNVRWAKTKSLISINHYLNYSMMQLFFRSLWTLILCATTLCGSGQLLFDNTLCGVRSEATFLVSEFNWIWSFKFCVCVIGEGLLIEELHCPWTPLRPNFLKQAPICQY